MVLQGYEVKRPTSLSSPQSMQIILMRTLFWVNHSKRLMNANCMDPHTEYIFHIQTKKDKYTFPVINTINFKYNNVIVLIFCFTLKWINVRRATIVIRFISIFILTRSHVH